MKSMAPYLRFYGMVLILVSAGWGWLLLRGHLPWTSPEASACLFKNISGIPCPSCGSTRSLEHLLTGKIKEAIFINPLGLFLALIMVLIPLWIFMDIIMNKDHFYKFYLKKEAFIRQGKVAILLLLLVMANWIWNIYKGL